MRTNSQWIAVEKWYDMNRGFMVGWMILFNKDILEQIYSYIW